MIWIVLVLCVLCVLCIAVSCLALWYREKWNESEDKCRALERENRELSTGQRITISDNANMLANNINLQNELIALRGKYEQSEFQCDLLRKESDDKSKRIVALLGEVEQLRSQLPKRDSKGRFCKRKEELYLLDADIFPEVTFENSPKKVELKLVEEL